MARFVLTILPVILLPVAAAADDPNLADLNKAKAAHSKELARLRDKLLADIDAVIKAERDRGAGIDYLLKERKGFAENGVLPLLSKLLPASRQYTDAKHAADASLEAAYTAAIDASVRAKKVDQAAALRADLKRLRAESAPPPAAGTKDPRIEADAGRAKSNYRAAIKAAAADLIEALEAARTRIAASSMLGTDEKLKALDLLKRERRGFEANATLPTSSAMRPGRKQFDDAAHRAGQAFAKAMDAAAAAYMEHNDLADAEAVTDEKKRLLVHPNSIDLLSWIDGARDAVAGKWDLRKGLLRLIEPAEVSIIQVPYEPGPEYNLHLTVERLDGRNYFAVGLVAGGRQCTLMLDGWPDSGHKSGIQLIDGKYVIDDGTAVTGSQLPVGKVVHIDVAVRKDSIAAWVKRADQAEKRLLIDYTGPQDRLSIETDFLKGVRNPKALLLHAHTSRFAVSSLELDPVGPDAGKPAR